MCGRVSDRMSFTTQQSICTYGLNVIPSNSSFRFCTNVIRFSRTLKWMHWHPYPYCILAYNVQPSIIENLMRNCSIIMFQLAVCGRLVCAVCIWAPSMCSLCPIIQLRKPFYNFSHPNRTGCHCQFKLAGSDLFGDYVFCLLYLLIHRLVL